MSIVATAEFFVKPGMTEEFLGLLKEVLPDTRRYRGCELVETHVNQDNPNLVFLFERWASRADQEAYRAWRAESGMAERLGPLVDSPPKVSYFDARSDI